MLYYFVKATRPLESSILFVTGGPSYQTSIVYLGAPFNRMAARNPNWRTLFNSLDVANFGFPFGATDGKYKLATIGLDSYNAPSVPPIVNPTKVSGQFVSGSAYLLSSRTADTASLFNSLDAVVNGMPVPTRAFGAFSTGNVELDPYTPPVTPEFVNPTVVSGAFLGGAQKPMFSNSELNENDYATMNYSMDAVPFGITYGTSNGLGDNAAAESISSAAGKARVLGIRGSVTNPTLGGTDSQWAYDSYRYIVRDGFMSIDYYIETALSTTVNTEGSGYYYIPMPSGWAIDSSRSTTPTSLVSNGTNVPLESAGTQVGTGTWSNTGSIGSVNGSTTIHTGSQGLMVRVAFGGTSSWMSNQWMGIRVVSAHFMIKFTATIPVVAV